MIQFLYHALTLSVSIYVTNIKGYILASRRKYCIHNKSKFSKLQVQALEMDSTNSGDSDIDNNSALLLKTLQTEKHS